mmetsp:Transcript_381/g.979  ORF Transcript_381/g.979 Transcript_381/m.979 type:complete len:298 (-) Transcript_381:877-1770(-)
MDISIDRSWSSCRPETPPWRTRREMPVNFETSLTSCTTRSSLITLLRLEAVIMVVSRTSDRRAAATECSSSPHEAIILAVSTQCTRAGSPFFRTWPAWADTARRKALRTRRLLKTSLSSWASDSSLAIQGSSSFGGLPSALSQMRRSVSGELEVRSGLGDVGDRSTQSSLGGDGGSGRTATSSPSPKTSCLERSPNLGEVEAAGGEADISAGREAPSVDVRLAGAVNPIVGIDPGRMAVPVCLEAGLVLRDEPLGPGRLPVTTNPWEARGMEIGALRGLDPRRSRPDNERLREPSTD